jgi:hypothetical protein
VTLIYAREPTLVNKLQDLKFDLEISNRLYCLCTQYPQLRVSAMLALCKLMAIDADFWYVPFSTFPLDNLQSGLNSRSLTLVFESVKLWRCPLKQHFRDVFL